MQQYLDGALALVETWFALSILFVFWMTFGRYILGWLVNLVLGPPIRREPLRRKD